MATETTEQKELKMCTGCGHRSDQPIEAPALACCPDSNYAPIGVYQMNDCDWVAAHTMECAQEYYMEMVGSPKDKASAETLQHEREEFLDDPQELSLEAMEQLVFVDTEVSCEYCAAGTLMASKLGIQPRHKVGAEAIPCEMPRRTFKEQLALIISQGEEIPCLFATTEY